MSIKLSGLSQEETDKILPTNTILLGYMGSISHGTHVPKEDPTSIDDIDIMGVNITHESTYLGLGYYYKHAIIAYNGSETYWQKFIRIKKIIDKASYRLNSNATL